MSQGKLRIGHGLFGWSYQAEYTLTLALPPYAISTLFDNTLRAISPAIKTAHSLLTDVKGRDSANLLDGSVEPPARPQQDEILFVQGAWFGGEVQDWSGAQNLESQSFELRLHTRFIDFLGSHHIRHRLEEVRLNLPQTVSWAALGRAFPLEITRFRIALEFFQSQGFSVMLGFAPTVVERFLMEADQKRALLKIEAEKLKQRASLPLQRQGLFESLCGALQGALGFDLKADYLRNC